jgi:small-conductance mechanosensitive channel
MREVLLAILPLIAAGASHWVLWIAGRRGPLWLSRLRRTDAGAAKHLRWRHIADLVLMPVKLGVWAVGIYFACQPFESLRERRSELGALVSDSFTRPLFTVSERSFSAVDLLLLPLFLGLLWAAASLLAWLLRTQILQRAYLAQSVQEGVSSIVRYAVLLFGAIIVLRVWGIEPGTLAIVGSVLGIGLGFGMQNIANNFVSGILLGLERPIKPGDFVQIGSFIGTVQRIGARSTLIQTQDRVNILIPNSRFLETEVINWSHENPLSRIHVPVTVAYGTSMEKLRALLAEVARQHPQVLREPRPEVRLASFGASGLEMDLLVFTKDPRRQDQIVSELNFGVESALRRAGIEIPLSRVDLRVRESTFDRAVEAWRRNLPGADEDEDQDSRPSPAPLAVGVETTGIFMFRRWTPEKLDDLERRMRGAEGVERTDRRHHLQVYPCCFLGDAAVDWLVDVEGLTRQEAIDVGNLMLERDQLHHVLDEHSFEDRPLFYRFRADDPAESEPEEDVAEEDEPGS